MEEKANAGLKEQRERRKRINRMKTGIIMSIFIWMLVSMILCITLLVKIHSLEAQIDTLTMGQTTTSQIDNPKNESANNEYEVIMTEYDESEKISEQSEESEESGAEANAVHIATSNVMSTADDANRAKEGDQLKVYLTFDDGPSSNTAEILDILAEYNLKATFFVIGKEDEESQALYQRIVDEGHTLGMHSYTHKYSSLYESIDGFEEDLTRIQNYLYDLTGEECVIYRFPGGSSNRVSNTPMNEFISYLNEQGIVYYDWNVSSGDATSQAYTAEELVENVLTDVVKYKTSIVLMHDAEAKDTTVEALVPMIEALKELDAQILPIDEDTTAIQHITADSVQ